MATVKSGLTLMELATHLAAFEEGWAAPACITLQLERPRAGGLRWQVKVECNAEVTPEGDRVHFEASSHFPNNSHQTLLGTVLFLAHSVDQQVHATRTLKAR